MHILGFIRYEIRFSVPVNRSNATCRSIGKGISQSFVDTKLSHVDSFALLVYFYMQSA